MNQPQANWMENAKATMGWSLLVMRAMAISVEVFLHESRTFGERYLGVQAVVAVIGMMLYAEVAAGVPNGTGFVIFMLWSVFLIVYARAKIKERVKAGEPLGHSFYTGRPRVAKFFPNLEEIQVKAFVEPAMVIGAGVCMMRMCPPLAVYLAMAGSSLSMTVQMSLKQERSRLLDLNDNYLESREEAERFRQSRGE